MDAKKKKGKKSAELTDEQALRKLFPKPVREKVKQEAEEADRKAEKEERRHDKPS